MRRVLIPVLLLTSAAITSTLPLQPNESDDGQQTDNIFRSSNTDRDILRNIIYTIPDDTNEHEPPEKVARYDKTNNERYDTARDDFISKANAYNDDGFRKDQWHNYPRRLDRLQDYIPISQKHSINQFLNEYDNDNILGQDKIPGVSDRRNDDSRTNEFVLDRKDGTNIYDNILSATNPLFILKLRLACSKHQCENVETQNYDDNSLTENIDLGKDSMDFGLFDSKISSAAKVKREEESSQGFNSDEDQPQKKTVNKRLFSLWSRLQSLSHKGHELPHRRHLAFYGMPEAAGGAGADAALSAQTRALMRPPGSPLRWG